MSMVPPTPSPLQDPNIVPTRHTRHVASLMIAALATEGGYEAVLKLHGEVRRGQWPALVAVLLNTGRIGGRPPIKDTKYAEGERRQAHARYRAGNRSPGVLAGEREYQRLHKRSKRAT